MRKNFIRFIFCSVFISSLLLPVHTTAQTKVKKVILQAFWWDYWNNNYRYSWANYLAELAPRLKAVGIDAVWIPPSMKNATGGSVGYSPFDMYDLGDKFQKGGDSIRNKTRSGTKDELLRMIAVMHANGIEVIEDAVMNHCSNAGTNSAGTGGQDATSSYSTATDNGYKNFRYVSYATPLIDESQNDYWTRAGRWSKNYQNFHPTGPLNNCTGGDICSSYWGPDIDYETSGAVGQSGNIPTSGTATIGGITRPYFNPAQPNNYMTDNGRSWIKWFSRQTNIDGYRFDAVKHFDINAQKYFINEAKYGIPSWAAGGENMLSIAEWVSSATDIDNYMNNVSGGIGGIGGGIGGNGVAGEKHTGTYDFALRGYSVGGIYRMVLGNSSPGDYDMATLPGCQQNNRYQDYGTKRVHRTVPFVNSHDTYRPKLDASGNFLKPLGDVSGWDVGNELGGNGAHIDPREPRLAAAYAVACAVDGNPAVFFEDLLDIGTTGKRWTHLPTSETDLPIRGDIKNIIQCHQKLGFKDGNYGVPTAVNSPYFPPLSDANLTNNSANYIVFERIGKALIGITDYYHFFPPSDNSFDRQVYCKVDDSWPVGTVLYDYTGAHGLNTVTIPADRRVFIQTPPVNHSITGAFGHGYSVWAPKPAGVTFTTVQDMYDYLATYIPGRSAVTTQEWEMADDLGDSHCQSLGQGGRLPDNVTRERIAGRIFVANGTNVSYTLTPETTTGNSITIALYDTSGNIVSSASGAANTAIPVTGNWTASYTGWVTIKVRNTNSGYAGQKVWARAAYTAPTVITANSGNGLTPIKTSIWTGNKNTSDVFDCGNWEGGLIPNSSSNVIVYGHAAPFPVLTTNLSINKLTLMPGASFTVNPGINLTILSQ